MTNESQPEHAASHIATHLTAMAGPAQSRSEAYLRARADTGIVALVELATAPGTSPAGRRRAMNALAGYGVRLMPDAACASASHLQKGMPRRA